MIQDAVWVDVRAGLQALIDGTEHAGHKVTARYEQSANQYGEPPADQVEVIVFESSSGGQISWVDRKDELTVEVYAPRGEAAKKVAESVLAMVAGTDVDTPEGCLDTVTARSTPVEVPYASAVLSKAVMTLQVISRPL